MVDFNEKRSAFSAELERLYCARFPQSQVKHNQARVRLLDGQSHPGRFSGLFPPCVQSASGGELITVEGETLLDLWQGHFTNILGHNSAVALSALEAAMDRPLALQLGAFCESEAELAELICLRMGTDKIRFTTSGTLATMYSIMLGLAHTNRSIVVKAAGGWHGSHPWALKGVRFPNGIQVAEVESAGLFPEIDAHVMTVPFNDPQALRDCFVTYGDRIGVLILELVLGNAGMVMATPEFVSEARELTHKYGTVLVFDEIVTGFRMCAGGLANFYKVSPDIVTLAKIASGGMPLACFAGRSDIFQSASTSASKRVWADGGTFSAHPASLAVALAVLRHLVEHEKEIYPAVLTHAQKLRRAVSQILQRKNIAAHVTGEGTGGIPDFPIGTVRFLKNPRVYDSAKALSHWDDSVVDIDLRDRLSRMALMLYGIHTWQGLGVIVSAHTDQHLAAVEQAYEQFSSDIKDIVGRT